MIERIKIARIARSKTAQRGQALIPVLAISLGSIILLTAMMTFAINTRVTTTRDTSWNGSLSAAEAGIDDYLYRLNQDSNYWRFNATNLPPASSPNPALTGYKTVPGPTTKSTFKYSVDSAPTATTPLKVKVTGKVLNTTRTVLASLRRRSFIDYLYFTEYDTKDPSSYGSGDSLTPAQAGGAGGTAGLCNMHYYEGRDSRCTEIVFTTGDVINGPLHSNDALNMCGTPSFPVSITTSNPNLYSGKRWINTYGCSGTNPSFGRAGDPKLVDPLTMPPSNSDIKNQSIAAYGGTGCMYTGPTQITLNSTGTMNVISPFSVAMNGCAVGNNVPLPPNGVIFVQNVPAATTDPNYTNLCTAGFYPSTLPPGPSTRPDITPYACTDGDVFISGTLKGLLTVASAHNIIITGNLTYSDLTATSTDLLGLVAQSNVQVYHPVKCASSCSSGSPTYSNLAGSLTNPTIRAAVLSVLHTFTVQNYDKGATLGTINLTGAIAQLYRGPVGTSGGSSGTGYLKNYVYDGRLKILSPPFFLNPVDAAWQVVQWAEIKTT